ncbi:MAG: hypothetical protein ACREOO_04600 [bacterium]
MEENQEPHFSYDFVYLSEEPAQTWFYPSWDFGVGVFVDHWLIETKFKLPLIKTHQIFPLQDETALYTLSLTLGYEF